MIHFFLVYCVVADTSQEEKEWPLCSTFFPRWPRCPETMSLLSNSAPLQSEAVNDKNLRSSLSSFQEILLQVNMVL